MKALASYWELTEQLLGQSLPHSIAENLIIRYAEQHRAYHTPQHLQACFAHFEQVQDQCDHPDEVALALWFHDAIYDTHAHDNEEKSAELAVECLISQKIMPIKIERVRKLISATKHLSSATDNDTALLLDIDIGILGSSPTRYVQYEKQIREEYCWVPEELYKQGRKKVLQQFLAHPCIYASAFFKEQYEQQAQLNLRKALSELA